MKERTLFDVNEPRKQKVFNYRNSKSKNGSLSLKLSPETAQAVKEYCHLNNLNCTKFVEQIMAEKMQELEQNKYDGLTKEELIEMLKERDRNHD